jgi:FkbM family methyltransferase
MDLYARWHAFLQRVDAFRGAGSLRTLRGLGSWPLRWTFARFVVESRLGIPNHGLLAPTGTEPRVVRDGYTFEPRDGTTDRQLLWHFHEVQTRWLLRRYLAASGSGGVFVDVGAHCGSLAIPFESCFDSVLAIEPMPDNYRALERNISLNGLERKIRLLKVAAGAASGVGTLFIKEAELHSLLPLDAPEGTLEVEIRRVDDLLEAAGIRSADVRLLKADVEGAELQVLEGARRLLEEGAPLVVLEANTPSAMKELEDRMSPLGYVLLRVADNRNLFFARSLAPIVPRVVVLGAGLASRLRKRGPRAP